MMIVATMLSASEKDSAINQIIESLQSDFSRLTKESLHLTRLIRIPTMEKFGDISLVPDKVLTNEQLYIDEPESIVLLTIALPEEELMAYFKNLIKATTITMQKLIPSRSGAANLMKRW